MTYLYLKHFGPRSELGDLLRYGGYPSQTLLGLKVSTAREQGSSMSLIPVVDLIVAKASAKGQVRKLPKS